MGMLAIFGTILFIICVCGAIFGTEKGKHTAAFTIAAIILVLVSSTGYFLEAYSKKHPVITVTNYRAFKINNVEFDDAMLVEKTHTKYRYISVFHNNTTFYKISPLED